jgi:hypothetical protein
MPPKVSFPKKGLKNVGRKPAVRNGRNAGSKIELHHILIGLLIIVAIIAFIYYMTRPSQKLVGYESFVGRDADLGQLSYTLNHPYTGKPTADFYYYEVPLSNLKNYTFPGTTGKIYTIILSSNGASGGKKKGNTGGGGGGGGATMICTFTHDKLYKPITIKYDDKNNTVTFTRGSSSSPKIGDSSSAITDGNFKVVLTSGSRPNSKSPTKGGQGASLADIATTMKSFEIVASANTASAPAYTPKYKQSTTESTYTETKENVVYLFDGGNGGNGGSSKNKFKWHAKGNPGVPGVIVMTELNIADTDRDQFSFSLGTGGGGGNGGVKGARSGSKGQSGRLFFYTKTYY